MGERHEFSPSFRSIAVMAGGIALAWTAILSGGARESGTIAGAAGSRRPSPRRPIPLPPSYAPADPVDCTDPNNVINLPDSPIDSPLVVGTAEPGSPFRD